VKAQAVKTKPAGELRNVVAVHSLGPNAYDAVLDCGHVVKRRGQAATRAGREIGRLASCIPCVKQPS